MSKAANKNLCEHEWERKGYANISANIDIKQWIDGHYHWLFCKKCGVTAHRKDGEWKVDGSEEIADYKPRIVSKHDDEITE